MLSSTFGEMEKSIFLAMYFLQFHICLSIYFEMWAFHYFYSVFRKSPYSLYWSKGMELQSLVKEGIVTFCPYFQH